MIDWLTLRLDLHKITDDDLETIRGGFNRVICVDPAGEIVWQSLKRESLRSDTHRLTVYLGHDFEIAGSPARIGNPNNVFGSGDPVYCAAAMIQTVNDSLGLSLPVVAHVWRATRMDVTQNYDMGGPVEVKQALSYLRHSESGRYQVRTKHETVYWSPASAMRCGKAYHKGPHLLYQQKKGDASATPEELNLADRLLRLELALRAQFWRERSLKPWHSFTETELNQIHYEFFSYVCGKVEVEPVDDLLAKCEEIGRSTRLNSSHRP